MSQFPSRSFRADPIPQPPLPVDTNQFIGDVVDSDFISAGIGAAIRQSLIPADPGFRLTIDDLRRAAEGLPDEFIDDFAGARSQAELLYIRNRILQGLEREERLAQAGFGGATARFGMNVLDPIADTIDAAITLGAGPLGIMSISTRLGRVSATAGLAAASNTIIESALVANDPLRSADDLVYAAAIGGVFGAVLGTGSELLRFRREKALLDLRKQLELEELNRADLPQSERDTILRAAGIDEAELAREQQRFIAEAEDRLVIDFGEQPIPEPATIEVFSPAPTKATAAVTPLDKAPRPVRGLGRSKNLTRSESEILVDRVIQAQEMFVKGKNLDGSPMGKGDKARIAAFLDSALERPEIERMVRERLVPADADELDDIDVSDVFPESRRSPSSENREAPVAGLTPEEQALADLDPDSAAAEAAAAAAPEPTPDPITEIRALARIAADTPIDPTDGNPDILLTLAGGGDGGFTPPPPGEGFDGGFSGPDGPIVPVTPNSGSGGGFGGGGGGGGGGRVTGGFGGTPFSGFTLRNVVAPERDNTIIGNLRFGVVGQNLRHDVDAVRRLTVMLGADSLGGLRKGSQFVISAEEFKNREIDRRLGAFAIQTRRRFNEFRRTAESAPGVGLDRGLQPVADTPLDAFLERVGVAVRNGKGSDGNAAVESLADFVRGYQRALLEDLQRAGVKGFETIPPNDNYLMRKSSYARMRNLVRRVNEAGGNGTLALQDLIRSAALRANPDMADDPELLQAFVEGWVRGIWNSERLTDLEKSRMFAVQVKTRAEAIQIFKSLFPEMSDAQVKNLAFRMVKREGGDNPRAMRRALLDESTEIQVETPNGPQTVRFSDILDNNAYSVIETYTRQVVGERTIQEVFRSFGDVNNPIDSISSLMDRVKRSIEDQREGRLLTGADRKALENLRLLAKTVRGEPLHTPQYLSDFLRLVRKFNFARIGGTFGFAQVSEFGSLIAHGGVRSMLIQMPALRQVFRRLKDGTAANEAVREFEYFTGAGTSPARHQFSRLTGDDLFPESQLQGTGRAIERRLDGLNRMVARFSGFNVVDTALQRGIGLVGAQKFADIIQSGRLPSKRRARAMGLDVEAHGDVLRRIRGLMDKHVERVESTFSARGRVKDLHVERWFAEDAEAAEFFVGMIDKWSRRSIQRNDIGSMSSLMTTDFGRSVIQFRSFVLQAWEKQFLFNLRAADLESFTSFSLTSFFGAIAYSGLVYAQSIGRADADEFRQKRLSLDAIASAAVQRSPHSSILPPLIDTMARSFGLPNPINPNARFSQLPNDILFGNPSTDALNRLPALMSTIAAPILPGIQLNERDARSSARLLGMNNILGISNVIDAVTTRLPSEREEE